MHDWIVIVARKFALSVDDYDKAQWRKDANEERRKLGSMFLFKS